jgi:type IV fimbrial biogenesis protein FimT
LIELLAGLVILSVLVSLAAPSFSRMLAEQRLRQAGSELRISLATARSEAVKRNEAVSLVAYDGGWSSGWCVEPAVSGACTGQPIQEFTLPSDLITLGRGDDVGGDVIEFNSWGRVADAADCPQLSLSTMAGNSTCNLCLIVTKDGRVESHSGTCTSACDVSNEGMSWAGSCS